MASMLKSKFEIGIETELTFLRYFVIPNKRNPKRSSLLLEFIGWPNRVLAIVQCWIELRDGHLYARGPNKGLRLPDKHFRVSKELLLYHWLVSQGFEIKNYSEAHSGFTRQMKKYSFIGIVRKDIQKSSSMDNAELKLRTHITVLNRQAPQKRMLRLA